MRGQVHIVAVATLSLMLISAGALSLFTTSRIASLAKTTDEAQLASSVATLRNLIASAANPGRGSGTTTIHTISLPSSVKQLCFSGAESDKYFSPELGAAMELNPDANVFLFGEVPVGFTIDNFMLEDTPECIEPQGRFSVQMETSGDTAIVIPQHENVPPSCVAIKQIQDPDKALDIVFVPHNFDNEEDFNRMANAYTQDALAGIEPFESFQQHINFFRTGMVEVTCRTRGYIQCNDQEVRVAAKNCPNDVIIVLHNRNPGVDVLAPLRSSALDVVIALNTAEPKTVIAHELGHILAGLADEYVDDTYYTNFDVDDYPNCDYGACNKWQSYENTGCFSGCSRSSYFRPTESSIMKDLAETEFGSVSEEAMYTAMQELQR